MVTCQVPVFAAELPVNVSVLLPLPGAGNDALLKAAVTPVGRPLTEKETAELNPPTTVVATETGAAPLWAILSAEAPNVN